MTSKTILNTNAVIALRDVQEAIKQGYHFVPAKSDVVEWPHNGLLEIDLYQQDIDVETISFEEQLDTVYINTFDKIKFITLFQKLVLNEYEVDLNSIDYLASGTKRCKMVRYNHPARVQYTREQLDEMDFDELKAISRLRGCFNRQRSVLITNLLKFQEERE